MADWHNIVIDEINLVVIVAHCNGRLRTKDAEHIAACIKLTRIADKICLCSSCGRPNKYEYRLLI